MNKKNITLMVVAIATLITFVGLATYAYFVGNINTTRTSNVTATTERNNLVFDTNGGAMELNVSAANMQRAKNGTVAAQNSTTLTVNLTANTDYSMVCTYDIVYEWTSTDKYTSHSSGVSSNEFTIKASLASNSNAYEGTNNIANETDLSSLTYTNNSATVVSGAQIDATGTTRSTAVWTLESKIYNVNANQTNLVNKNFGGRFKIANVSCVSGNVTATYLSYDSNSNSFSWNEVNDASLYEIYVDNQLVTRTSQSSIEQWKLYQEAGNHDVYVKALDSSNNIISESNIESYNLASSIFSTYNSHYYHGNGFSDYEYSLNVDPFNVYIYDGIVFNDSIISYVDYVNILDIENRGTGYVLNYDSGSGRWIKLSDNSRIDVDYMINMKQCITLANYCETYSIEDFDLNYLIGNANYRLYYENNEIVSAASGKYAGNYKTFLLQLVSKRYESSKFFLIGYGTACLTGDTEVYVYDEKRKKFKKKKIKDINYDDNILVWDFDHGHFTTAKPLVIKKKEYADKYHRLEFDDGSILKIINNHRIFNNELGKFTPGNDKDLTPIGTTTFNSNGEYTKLVKRETIYERVDYYNIVTNYHLNLFTSDILTSCRFNNIYPIKKMSFVKKQRELNKFENFEELSKKYFDGFRVAEQPLDVNRDGGSLRYNDIEDYIFNNFLKNMK